ncbi:MAG: hypothetical protein U9N33_03905 [Campylobacterota bacterium]|nr:hypothetical protein [Campylobacterota bacterium]
MKRVAYQGVKGAYSHLACHHVYPKYEAIACKSSSPSSITGV